MPGNEKIFKPWIMHEILIQFDDIFFIDQMATAANRLNKNGYNFQIVKSISGGKLYIGISAPKPEDFFWLGAEFKSLAKQRS